MRRRTMAARRRGERHRRPIARTLLVAACLTMAGCFLPAPIRESVEIDLRDWPRTALRVDIEVASAASLESGSRLAERVERERESLSAGRSPWFRRIEDAAPLVEQMIATRHEGRLRSIRWELTFEDADSLEELLADADLPIFIAADERGGSLSLNPRFTSRLTREEREIAETLVDEWSATAAAYLEAVDALYSEADSHPDRAGILIASFFRELLDLEAGDDELSEKEAALVGSVLERMVDLLEVLSTRTESAYTLDELSRLHRDPFPFEVTVLAPGQTVESVGFIAGEDGAYRVPVLSIMRAMLRLEPRWAEPGPLGVYWRLRLAPEPGAAEPTDAVALSLAARRRRAEAPSAAEIERSLEAELTPAREHHLAWRLAPGTDEPSR